MKVCVAIYAACILLWGLALPSAVAAEVEVLQTPAGTHYGLAGKKPAKPAPTLFIIGSPITLLEKENLRYFRATGEILSTHGWVYVLLDPAGEGHDLKPGQPSSLPGWAIRAQKNEDFIAPYVRNCIDVLDHLIAEGITDPQRVAVQGVSRGGFCGCILPRASRASRPCWASHR